MSWFNTRCSKLLLIFFLATPILAQDNLTARRPFGQHTVTFSATPVFDAGISDSFKITLTGNVTSSTMIGPEAGHTYTFEICQDGAGSHTFVWPSQMVGASAISSTANACTQEIFPFDGTSAINPTTTAGGGGSGTVSGPGTVKQMAIYTGATTVSSDSTLDDNSTNANGLTYSGTAGVFSPSYNATGAGALIVSGTEGTCSGSAAGKSVLCLGDSTSHSAQLGLNGISFFPIALHQSTSPTPHGIMVAETFPQMFALPVGAAGQPMLSNGNADPGFGSINLAGGATIVNGILPKLNHPTTTMFTDQVNTGTAALTIDLSASTIASSFRVENKAGLTTSLSGALGYDTTNNNFHAGMNSADSIIPVVTITPIDQHCMKWAVTSGNITFGDAGAVCGAGGGNPPLSTVTAAGAANSINNGDFAQTWNWSLTTAGKKAFTFTENSASTATGTPYLVSINSIATSTALPLLVTGGGTANGVQVDTTGLLSAIGTGGIKSTTSTQSISTTSPLGGGGAFTGNLTLTCTNCVDKSAVNTGLTGMTLDMSGATTANAFRVPLITGGTSGSDGAIVYDSTAKITHVRTNAADSDIMATTVTDTTTTDAVFASSTAGLYTSRAIALGDLPNIPINQVVSATGTIATIANGNHPLPITCAQTTNTQDCVAIDEASAATGGTLTSGFANQAQVEVSTASNSTATPLEVTQGSITNTVATPLAQFETTWNNGSLSGAGLVVSVTNTASATASKIFQLFGGTTGTTNEFSVSAAGAVVTNSAMTLGSALTLGTGAGISQSGNGNMLVQSGGDVSLAGTQGTLTVRASDNPNNTASSGAGSFIGRGGNETGASGATETGGSYSIFGGNVISTATTGVAGTVPITGGACVNITSANTCNGAVKINQPYFTTGTATVNDLACVTAANTIASCPSGSNAFIGVIDSVTSNSVFIMAATIGGTHTFNATSATFTNGDHVCQGTGASSNLVFDNGGTPCNVGRGVGIYIGATGTTATPLVFMRAY